MEKEKNNGEKNIKKGEKIPIRFGRRDIYMNRKKNIENTRI